MGSYGNERYPKLYPGSRTLRDSFKTDQTPTHAGLASSPVEHLLVATDFTEHSDCAVERAVKCGNTLGAQVTVLHVIEPGLPRKIAKRRQCAAREFLTNHVRVMYSNLRSDISINVRIGDPYLEIVREAIELGSDTIILGLDGPDAFSDAPTASTATAVVRYCHKPVLLVTRRPVGPYRRSVVDVSVAPQRTVSSAYRLAPAAEPTYVLDPSRLAVGIDDSDEDPVAARLEQLRRLVHELDTRNFDPHSMPVRLLQVAGDPADALLVCIDKLGADLLAVSSDGVLQETCEDQRGLVQEAALRCDLLLVGGE